MAKSAEYMKRYRAAKRNGNSANSDISMRIPDAIQAAADKVKKMAEKSQYGELQGDIKITRDENGNYNLSYTQVKNYDRLESATMGVGDIPARRETTHTTYVLNGDGKRIDTKRKTDVEYYPQSARQQGASNDWTGANANAGTSMAAKRRMSDAMRWAETQMRRK